jgi:hypothetical protein
MTDKPNDEMFKALDQVLRGKPIDDVAPLLVIAVARMLVIDAEGDNAKLAMLTAKFMFHMTEAMEEMVQNPGESVH